MSLAKKVFLVERVLTVVASAENQRRIERSAVSKVNQKFPEMGKYTEALERTQSECAPLIPPETLASACFSGHELSVPHRQRVIAARGELRIVRHHHDRLAVLACQPSE